MDDQQRRVGPHQSLLEESALDTLIACENDGLPLDTEHIPKRWYFHVPDRYRGQLNIGGDPDPHNPIIRRVDFDWLKAWEIEASVEKPRKISIGAGSPVEIGAQERANAREVLVPPRADDGQWSSATVKRPAVQDCGQIGHMIGVEMADQDGVKIVESRAGFRVAQKHAAARIKEKARTAVYPN
jgi:hypothetical protein